MKQFDKAFIFLQMPKYNKLQIQEKTSRKSIYLEHLKNIVLLATYAWKHV